MSRNESPRNLKLLRLFSYKSGIPFRSYATLCNQASAHKYGNFLDLCTKQLQWKWLFVLKIQVFGTHEKCVICLDFS